MNNSSFRSSKQTDTFSATQLSIRRYQIWKVILVALSAPKKFYENRGFGYVLRSGGWVIRFRMLSLQKEVLCARTKDIQVTHRYYYFLVNFYG